MECNNQKKSNIEDRLSSYNDKLKEKSQKEMEIMELKNKIIALQNEQDILTMQMNEDENIVQIEIYESYTEKDLLKMAAYIDKHAKTGIAQEFRGLIRKFQNHNLQINDISSLQTYFKIYGSYVKEENKILRKLFGAFGGKLDE